VSSLKNNGLPLFMQKLNGGYSRYFNKKYKRRGSLFESRYRAIKVKDESHFVHLPFYIHLNPLDYSHPTWRNRLIANPRNAFAQLLKYKWSSHLDYLGIKNFPSLTQREFLNEFFGGPTEYKNSIYNWLTQLSTLTIPDIVKYWE
jgi:putative transposase